VSQFPKVWGQGDSQPGEKQLAPLAGLGSRFAKDSPTGADRKGAFEEITPPVSNPLTLRYEFFLPEAIPITVWPSGSTAYATQDPIDTDGRGVVAGNACSWKPGATCRAVFSHTLTPDPDLGQHWRERAIWPLLQVRPSLDDRGVVAAPTFFKSWPSWQNQMGPEHAHYPGMNGKELIVSVRGYGYGLANNAGFWMPNELPSIATGTPGVSARLKYHNDVGKDIAAAYYTSEGLKAVGTPALPDHIDWRRAAIVRSSAGRKFVVLSDTHGYFHFFLARNYVNHEDGFRALPQTDVVTSYLPPYPAWMTADPATTGSVSRSGTSREAFLWHFSADGDRVVGVPFSEQKGKLHANESGVPTLRAFYLADATGAVTVLGPAQSEATFDADPAYVPGRWQKPGLVEFTIAIEDNGTDWEPSMELADSTHYDDDGRYIVDAAYLARARHLGEDAEDQLGAPEGTLLTAEIELYWDPTSTYPKIGRNTAPENLAGLPANDLQATAIATVDSGMRNLGRVFYTVRRHDTGAVIRRFQLSRYFGGKCPGSFLTHVGTSARNTLVHADLRALQFYVVCSHGTSTTLTGKSTQLVYAWNELEASVTNRVGTVPDAIADALIEAAPPTAPLIQLPAADSTNRDTAMFFMQSAALYLIDPRFFAPFTWHPWGNWSSGPAASIDTTGELDVVQAYRGDGTAHDRVKHVDLFNEAFDESRTSTFHTPTPDTDLAPMLSAGLWRFA
jgi:hypothetical protein